MSSSEIYDDINRRYNEIIKEMEERYNIFFAIDTYDKTDIDMERYLSPDEYTRIPEHNVEYQKFYPDSRWEGDTCYDQTIKISYPFDMFPKNREILKDYHDRLYEVTDYDTLHTLLLKYLYDEVFSDGNN